MADDSEAIWAAVQALRDKQEQHSQAHADLRVEVSDLRGVAARVLESTQRQEQMLATYSSEGKVWREGVDKKLEEVAENRGAMRVVVWVVGVLTAIGMMVAGWRHGDGQ